jgi:hypothetical protein
MQKGNPSHRIADARNPHLFFSLQCLHLLHAARLSPICSKPPRDCPVHCSRLLCPDSFFTIYLAPGIWASGILQSCCWIPLAAGTPPTWTTAHPRWSTGSLEGAVDQARQIRRNLRRPDRFSDPTVQAQSNLLYLMSSVTPSAWPVGWGGAGE